VRPTPAPPISWEKLPEPEIEFFTNEQIDALVQVGDPMVTVAVKTGLRLGELLALRWADIRDNKITVSKSVWWCEGEAHEGATKSNRIRVVPLPQSAQDALSSIGRLSEFVFCGPEGERLTKNGVKRRLWNACEAAQLEKCGWHKLRHSFVSELVRLNVPLPQVQKLAGHSTIQMTLRYTHVHANDLVSAVNRLK
jgi:integrase